jgi:hypothetical protein
MPGLKITKELTATCHHKPNQRRKITLALVGLFLAASIGGLIAGCIIEVTWLIIVSILGIGIGVLAMFIVMDCMRKEYIKSQDQGYTIDRVTIFHDDADAVLGEGSGAKVIRVV